MVIMLVALETNEKSESTHVSLCNWIVWILRNMSMLCEGYLWQTAPGYNIQIVLNGVGGGGQGGRQGLLLFCFLKDQEQARSFI